MAVAMEIGYKWGKHSGRRGQARSRKPIYISVVYSLF